MTRTSWNIEQLKRFETALHTWQCGWPGAPVAAEELQRRQTLVDDLNKVPGGKTATMENVVKKAQKMRALAATTPQVTGASSMGASSMAAGGRGGKRQVGRPLASGSGSKKTRTITPKYGVFDRVLMGIYNEEEIVVAYALATVIKIEITADGCVYTITLDRDGAERTDVEEETLFKSVEAVCAT